MKLLTISDGILGAQILGHAGVYTAINWLAEMFASVGADVFEVGFGEAPPGPARRVSVSEATSMLVAGEIDAIYTQYVEGGAPFDLAAMSPRVIPVLSIGHDLFNAMPPLRSYLSSEARHPADTVVFSSEAGAQAFRQMIALSGGERAARVETRVLPLGVNVAAERPYRGSDNATVNFLWLGRFSETYKADLRPLLLAFRELTRREGPPVRLVLAGADSSGAARRLREHARRIGIDPSCTWRPDATPETRQSCLARADVLVNVSDHVQETFGLVNLEAMALGVPVIAGAWSGFRETIVHGKTGLLVPVTLDASMLAEATADPYGSVSLAATVSIPALADAMTVLRTSEPTRQAMGAAGHRRVAEVYATGVLAPQYARLVEERIEIARSGGERANPRAWMPHAFSQYGAPAQGSIENGGVDLALALDVVPDASLRAAMVKALQRWRRGYALGATGLERVALATLLKLDVLRWTEEQT